MMTKKTLKKEMEKDMVRCGFTHAVVEVYGNEGNSKFAVQVHTREDNVATANKRAYGERYYEKYNLEGIVFDGIPFPKTFSLFE